MANTKGKLPEFTDDGLMLPADYELTFRELRASLLVSGPSEKGRYAAWDASWRRQLVENLHVLVCQLWQVGVTNVFIDGFFVEDKEHPNDIDGYFE